MVKATQDQLVREILENLRRITRALMLDSKQTMRDYGLTTPQMLVLRVLAAGGELSSVELARALLVTPSNMTGIIDRLEKKELVLRKKKPGDRRISLIALTPRGAQLAGEVPDMTEEKLIGGLRDLGDPEIRRIHKAAARLSALLGTLRLPPELPSNGL